MRIFLLLTLLAGCCFGCGSANSYAEDINVLAQDWDKATMEVTAAVNNVADAQEAVNEAIKQMMETEGLAGEVQSEQQTIQKNLQAQSESLAEYAQRAFEFVNQWQEGAERLDQLKTSVKNNKTPAAVENTIGELRNMINMGLAKAEDWNKAASEAEATVSSAQQLIQ